MLSIHASTITQQVAEDNELSCAMVDSATVMAAEINKQYSGCPFPAMHAIVIRPADDMVVPFFLCTLHFNSLKIGIRGGVGLDQSLLN